MDTIEKAIKAVQQLKTAMNSLPKPPEMPKIKALSSPSISAAPKPAKLPGVGPDSKKEPKKIAEQLKAGQPPKAKIKEVLKTDHNGQWSIRNE